MAYGTGLAVEYNGETKRFSLSRGAQKKVYALQKSAKILEDFNHQSSCRGEHERITSAMSVPVLLEPGSGLGVTGAAALSCYIEEEKPGWLLAFMVGDTEVRLKCLKCTPFELWIDDPDYPRLF